MTYLQAKATVNRFNYVNMDKPNWNAEVVQVKPNDWDIEIYYYDDDDE